MDGPWKWFRKDGVIMRSGSFDRGVQVGEWITYDRTVKVYKVTHLKSAEQKQPKRPRPATKACNQE